MSLNRPSEWTCRKDGVECKFLAYKGSEFLEYDLVYEKETTEENGVSVKIGIHDWYEFENFKKEAKKQLSYYDEITLIIENNIFENTIYRNDLFQFCDESPYRNVHITLKDVVYEIDYNQLGITNINLPIALRFNLNSGLIPSISRESLVINDFAKKLILTRIKDVANYLIIEYNKTTHYDTFAKAYEFINKHYKYITICNKEFEVTQIDRHASTVINKITIEGAESLDLICFKNHLEESITYTHNLRAIDTRYGKWLKDKFYKADSFSTSLFKPNVDVVIVNESIVGRLKTYFRDKYSKNLTYYVNKYDKKMSLQYIFIKSVNVAGVIETKKVYDSNSYYSRLRLEKYPKDEWRKLIKEYQYLLAQITSNFITDVNILESVEYVEWLEKEKDERKQNRAIYTASSSYVSKAINKEKGEIAIKQYTHNKYENGLKSEISTAKIDSLYKTKKLSVYFDRKNETLPDNLYEMYKAFPSINFITLNPTEIKHVTNLHNFVTYKQFKMTKPFARLATWILAEEVLNMAPSSQREVIIKAFPKYQELYNKIKDYSNSGTGVINNVTRNIILDEAKSNNNWDFTIYSDILKYKAIISKFGFLKYLQIPHYGLDTTEQSVLNNIVYTMYKNNKINAEFIENMVLVPKSSLCVNDEQTPLMELSLLEQLVN